MPYEIFTVGIVAEESPPSSAWAQMTYVPVAILPGEAATAPWTEIGNGLRGKQFFIGNAIVEMFSGDTGLLRDNMTSGNPQIWIVLRPTGVNPPYELWKVTADPTIGEAAHDNPGDLVNALPMPAVIAETVMAFIEKYHVERPFVKRRRDQFEDDGSGERRLQKGNRR